MEAGELDALIALNIGDLEKALARVEGSIDPKINAAAWNALKRALHDADFHFDDDDDPDSAWFAPRSWLDKDLDSNPWFRLTANDGSALETWLACYVASTSEREAIGIQWEYENLYVRDYKAILDAHAAKLDEIEQAGFRRDGTSIYLPIPFDPAKLAEGLREGDLVEAMEPISDAAKVLEKALPAFQSIRDAIVAKAKSE